MKDGADAGGPEVVKDLITDLRICQDDIEHVVVTDAVFRDDGQ